MRMPHQPPERRNEWLEREHRAEEYRRSVQLLALAVIAVFLGIAAKTFLF